MVWKGVMYVCEVCVCVCKVCVCVEKGFNLLLYLSIVTATGWAGYDILFMTIYIQDNQS